MGINLPNLPPFNFEQVNTGINPNDGQGDLIPDSFRKINRNVSKLTDILSGGTPYTIYVNPHSITASDAPSNKGINPNTPFKTLQRATIQAAALSAGLLAGGADDLYDLVSIKAEVGSYRVENSPGQPGTNTIQTITAANKDGEFEDVCAPYSNFNPTGLELAADGQPTNMYGGLIVPRGVSIIGSDLRKAKIRPIYTGTSQGVIKRTSVFRLTGGSHFYGFSIFDKQNSTESQHTCDCFAFVSRSELELYYQKIAKAFANLLEIQDWTDLNIEDRPVAPTTQILGAREEEYTIVGAGTTPQNTNVVESSSPFVFNVSSRSVRGRCGINADGRLVEGFKSMVCANFTGIGLNNSSEAYTNQDPNSIDSNFKSGYRNFHIRAANNAFIEVVSCFAIGYADQFITESGGELSMTASKSDFGQTSLRSIGYQKRAYPKDAQGMLVALIPPKGLDPTRVSIIDISRVNIEKTITDLNNNAQFRRIYVGDAIAQEDIPEYIQNPGLTEEKRWLVIGNGRYLLGKRDGANESIFLTLYDYVNANTSALTSFVTKKYSDKLRNKINGGDFSDPLTNNNDKRQFYTWQPITPQSVDDRGRVLGHLYIHINKPPTDGVADYTNSNGKNILFRLFRKKPGTTEFEFLTRAIFSPLTVERVIDDRTGISPSELMWQVQYKVPKEALNPAPPDAKFILQSRVNKADVNNIFWIYDTQTVQRYVYNQQDGLYNLILVWGNVPVLGGSVGDGHSQNLNFLYPEVDLDKTRWNPLSSTSYYDPQLGISVSSDSFLLTDGLDRISQYSLTRECIDKLIASFNIKKPNSLSAFSTQIPYGGDNDTWGISDDTEDRKITIQPVEIELRRPSMLTALGHAWHYVGYGTGNYQNALPRNHKVILTTQQLINARGVEQNAGVVAATGTSSNGDFFIGNQLFDVKGVNNKTFSTPKLLTSATAREIDYSNPEALVSNELADFTKNQSQSFSTSNLTVTGTAAATNLIVAQEVNFASANKLSPLATKDKPGFIKLADSDDVTIATDDAKAVTPALLPIFVSNNLSALIKSIVTIRLSLSSTSPVPNDSNVVVSSTTLYAHPYGGNEVAVYDPTIKLWLLVPLKTGSSPQSFNLTTIGASEANTLYDIFAFNAGTPNNPELGLKCVAWTGNNTVAPSKYLQDGADVLASDFSHRYIGVIRTTDAGTSVIDLGGIRYLPADIVLYPGINENGDSVNIPASNYNPENYARVRTYYNYQPESAPGALSNPEAARCYLANAFNTYDVSLFFFFGTSWDSDWTSDYDVTRPTTKPSPNDYLMPPYYGERAQCRFVLAQRQLVTAFADIYSNPIHQDSYLYVVFGVNSTDTAAPDGFYGECSGANQTSTTAWARTLNPGYNYIQYLYKQEKSNWVNEHPSHGLIVTTKV